MKRKNKWGSEPDERALYNQDIIAQELDTIFHSGKSEDTLESTEVTDNDDK